MTMLMVFSLFAAIVAIYLTAAYLDAKHGWRLSQWLNGECNNPFINKQQKSADREKEELRSRIEVLEKIVTEPAYELNKKINALD